MTDSEFISEVGTLVRSIDTLKQIRSQLWEVDDSKALHVIEGIKRRVNMGLDVYEEKLIELVKSNEDNSGD